MAKTDSIGAVEREGNTVMFQVGEEMRFYALPDGTRIFSRKANFLRRCADGRWLAWVADGARYHILNVVLGATVADLPRAPGFVLGASASCRVLYTQHLDGTIVEQPLDGRPARAMATADGYVYDVRPSAVRLAHAPGAKNFQAPVGPADILGPGLYLALSSGAVARIDDITRSVQVLGYATPRAYAIADGPAPGDAIYSDGTGVVRVRPGQPPQRLYADDGGTEWSDLSLSPDHTSLLLAAANRSPRSTWRGGTCSGRSRLRGTSGWRPGTRRDRCSSGRTIARAGPRGRWSRGGGRWRGGWRRRCRTWRWKTGVW